MTLPYCRYPFFSFLLVSVQYIPKPVVEFGSHSGFGCPYSCEYTFSLSSKPKVSLFMILRVHASDRDMRVCSFRRRVSACMQ